MASVSKSARLRQLIKRTDKALVVLHPPAAAHGRIMERAGCEVGFVGAGRVVGAYTGLDDVGTFEYDRMRPDRRLDRTSREFPDHHRWRHGPWKSIAGPTRTGSAA